jgi:hypothetical protein
MTMENLGRDLRLVISVVFSTLYEIYSDKYCLVHDYWKANGWNIEFRRAMDESEFKD